MVQLPSKINKVVSMQLSSIEIPMTFYNISECYGNDYIIIGVDIQKNSNVTRYNTVLIIPTSF